MKCLNCEKKIKKRTIECPYCGCDIKILKKNRRRKRIIKFLVIIGLLVGVKVVFTVTGNLNTNEARLTNLDSVSESGDNYFKINKKLSKITGKISTLSKVKNGNIKLYINDLVLKEGNFTSSDFSLDDIILGVGLNQLDVSYTIDEKDYNYIFILDNQSLDNLGNLDNNDDDNDLLANYLEEAYSTDKNNQDTDNDGLTDYEEVYITSTDPTNPSTYNEIEDSKLDYDQDGLDNITEILFGSNPIKQDTDDDGLIDSIEYISSTDPTSSDTDNDGLTDYEEVINYQSDPNQTTTEVSGNVSNDTNIELNVEKIDVNDLDKITITEGNYAPINEESDSYLLPPYKVDSQLDTELELAFNLDNANIKEDANPTIYKIDNETSSLQEIESSINGNLISTIIDDKDSLYIVLDKNRLNPDTNKIKVGANNIQVSLNNNDRYLSADIPLLHLLLHYFSDKIAIPKQSYNIVCLGECEQEFLDYVEKGLEEGTENQIDFKFHKTSPFLYTFIKEWYNWLEKFILKLWKNDNSIYENIQTLNPDSVGKKFFDVLYIFDFIGIEDVENLVLGGTKYPSREYTIAKALNDELDTNEDGITDSMTELITSGYITTDEGFNPFKGLSLQEINKNKDLDNDSILNNEEITIDNSKGYYRLIMKSNPAKKDSDDDCILDTEDPYPLIAFDSKYVLRDTIKGEPTNIAKLKKEVEDYNSLFGKGTITEDNKIMYKDIDGIIKYNDLYEDPTNSTFSKLMANLTDFKVYDASKALNRYLLASGKTYTEEDASLELFNSTEIRYNMDEEINNYIRLGISTVKDGKTLVFENKNLGVGSKADSYTVSNYIKKLNDIKNDETLPTNLKSSLANIPTGIVSDLNNSFFLQYASNDSIAEINNNNGIYTIKLRYFIEDVYDWKKEVNDNNPSSITEVMYFNKLLKGEGKTFLVHIEYDATIKYNSSTGETNIDYYPKSIYK